MNNKFKEAFSTLELKRNSSYQDISSSFKDLIRIWHPDRYSHDTNLMQRALTKTKELNLAVDYLKSLGDHKFNIERERLFNNANPENDTEHNRQTSSEEILHPNTNVIKVLLLAFATISVYFSILLFLKHEDRMALEQNIIDQQQEPSRRRVSGPIRSTYQLESICPQYATGKIELSEIIKIFLLPLGQANMGAWSTGADSDNGILWITNGTIETELQGTARVGLISLLIGGRELTKALRNQIEECPHYITLSGVHGGYTKLEITNGQSEDIPFNVLEYLQSKGFILNHYSCDVFPRSSNVIIYEIAVPNRKKAWIKIGTDSGSRGVTHSISLILDEYYAKEEKCEY